MNETAWPQPRHTCGEDGFDPIKGDVCEACEAARRADAEEAYEADLPAELTAPSGPALDEWMAPLRAALRDHVAACGGDPDAGGELDGRIEEAVVAAMQMALRFGWPRRPPVGWVTNDATRHLMDVRATGSRLRGHGLPVWTRTKLPLAAQDGLRPVWIGPPTPRPTDDERGAA